ncbi:MAG: hypothetical protein COA38_17855 [Fluviicola sp.]|nr:MAG: hypothetical protein COA38_17855 [Fluviicola sp.]
MLNRTSYGFLFAAALTLFMGMAQAQTYTKKDSLNYNHAALVTGSDSTLYVRSSPTSSSTCSSSIQKASLYAYLHLGKTYKYGDATLSGSVKLKISAYNSYSGNSGLVDTYWITLVINENTPEQFFLKDFTAEHADINRFVVKILTYSSSSLVEDSIKLSVFFREDFDIDVSGVGLTNSIITVDNPITFKWNSDCKDVDNYQFQLLRLFNNDLDQRKR